jgi:ankyrin repeat protein
LLDAYAKIDQLVNGYTPLYAAARNGHLEIVQALLKAGASVNKANHLGETPLYIAAENGHVKIVRTLIEAGADVNVPDNKGLTPLQAARTYQPQAEGGDYKEIIDVLSQASSSCPPRPQ